MRLQETAQYAKQRGLIFFTKRLHADPQKRQKLINQLGAELGKDTRSIFLAADF